MPVVQKIIQTPDQNAVQFVDEVSPNALYQTNRPDNWFSNKIPFYDIQSHYCQKFVSGDKIVFQIHVGGAYATDIANHRVRIHDQDDKEVAVFFPTNIDTLPGHIYRANGVDYQLTTLTFAFSFAQFNIYDGYFYLRLAVFSLSAGVPTYEYKRSEPILVAAEHPRTILFEYTSFSNKNGILYKQGGTKFVVRIEGKVLISDLLSDAAGYDDQNMNPRQSSNITSRETTIYLGPKSGVPMWLLNKVNEIFRNDKVVVEKVRYVKRPEDKVIVDTKRKNYYRYFASLAVKEHDKESGNVVLSKSPLVLFTIPAFPFLIYKLAVQNSTSGLTKDIFTGYAVNNQQQLDDFTQGMNSYFIGNAGLTGSVAILNDKYCYLGGDNENYDTNLSFILTKKIDLHNVRSNRYAVPQIRAGLAVEGKLFAIVPRYNYEVYCYGDRVNLTTAIFNYNYTANGNPTTQDIQFWHEDTVTEIHLNTWSLTDIYAGSWPLGLEVLNIQSTSITGFSMAPIDTTLTMLSLANNPVLTDVIGLEVKNWSAMFLVNLRTNKFIVATVDRIINDFVASTTLIPNGNFLINSQVPPAGVTGASAAARATLNGAGWSVAT